MAKTIKITDHHADALQRIAKASGEEPHQTFERIVGSEHKRTFGVGLPGGHAEEPADDLDQQRRENAARTSAAIAKAATDAPGAKDDAFDHLDAVDEADVSASDEDSGGSNASKMNKRGAAANPLRSWAAAPGRSKK
jgi:hypothetical protein